jgi:hypothetical protein
MIDRINENNRSSVEFDLVSCFKKIWICLNEIDQSLIEIFLVKNRKRASNLVLKFFLKLFELCAFLLFF